MSYAHDKHYEWIESAHKVKCSDLGKQVANILGYVGRGIYNAPFKTEKVDWTNPQCIEVNWGQSMANWDGCYLTNLVIECHRRMVRVSIGPNMRTMKIQFWQRKSRTGSMSERLPDIEEMVKSQDEQWGRITTESTGSRELMKPKLCDCRKCIGWQNKKKFCPEWQKGIKRRYLWKIREAQWKIKNWFIYQVRGRIRQI